MSIDVYFSPFVAGVSTAPAGVAIVVYVCVMSETGTSSRVAT